MLRQILIFIIFITFSYSSFSSDKNNTFLEAAKRGDHETITNLLKEGVDVNVMDWADWTALNWSSLMLHTASIKILLQSGANIEHLGKGGKNSGRPLMMAAKKFGGLETVKLLIANGAKVDGRDQYGRTPLIMAARYGRLEIVLYLLKNGADPNSTSILDKWKSAIISAKIRGHKEVLEALLKSGATY